jgi:hypothetical protein
MQASGEELRDELRERRLKRWARQAGRRMLASVEATIALGGLVLAVLLQIPWLQGPLDRLGLQSAGVVQTLLLFILVSVFFEVRKLANRSENLTEQRHFADPMDVYPVLHARAKAITRDEDKVLDVLGISLYTAWPTVGFWLNRPDMACWTVRLAAVVRVEDDMGRLIPERWFRESRTNLTDVVETSRSAVARNRKITLQAYGYDFMPVLHGFRLGNGDLFYSILCWGDDGKIGRDDYSYEFVPHEDLSATADAVRKVFDSWFFRATRMPWHPEPAVESTAGGLRRRPGGPGDPGA